MAENQSVSIGITSIEQLHKAGDQFFEAYHDNIEGSSKRLEKAFDLNKQVSSFFERLLYINLGTLSLSVTAITTIAPRLQLQPPFKHHLLLSLAGAWICFMLSATLCRHMMQTTVSINSKLFNQWAKMSSAHDLQILARRSSHLAAVFTEPKEGAEGEINVREIIDNLTKALTTSASEASGSVATEGLKQSGEEGLDRWVSRFAVLFMQLGLFVLGYVAIRLIFVV